MYWTLVEGFTSPILRPNGVFTKIFGLFVRMETLRSVLQTATSADFDEVAFRSRNRGVAILWK